MHIYEWLDTEKTDENEKKVFEFLDFRTREEYWQMKNKHLAPKFDVFCIYENKKYKITGASRMGDVWLSKDFNRELGYDLRVDIDNCSTFSYISKVDYEK